MILHSLDSQFKLDKNGQITWQRDLTNPMPGEVVAEITKGDALLSPSCAIVKAESIKDENPEAVKEFVQTWLGNHIKTVLEPLFRLKAEDVPNGAAQEICDTLYNNLGVIERGEIETLIARMNEDERNILRTKKIRFGPLLVYLPELNKPAMVNLRGLLLTLWQDKDLPAVLPAEGIVSFSVEGQEVDKNYYRSIGYPVYGPRSVRVDMLDRVICTVYDSAENGKFQAQHKMAEWLGSNIIDLYAVLEAMGHKKIHDPADDVQEEKSDEAVINDEIKLEVENTEVQTESVKTEPAKVETPKPELATFALKKGKAISQPSHQKADRKFSSKKPNKKSFKKKPNDKPKKPQQRIYTAEAKTNPDDNPFAVLQQLKTKE